jgi:hypothetical protein
VCGRGDQLAFRILAFDLLLDALSGAGIGRVQRVIDLLAGDVVLDPPDAFLSAFEDGGHG